MSKKDDGGAAFLCSQFPAELSLRDYFAAAALTGFCANPTCYVGAEDKSGFIVSYDDAANDVYRLADAMLEARKK